MNKRDKALMWTIIVLVLSLFSVVFVASFRLASIETNYNNLAESIKNIKSIDGIDGKDGKPGLNGSNGVDGVNGTNSISEHLKETFYVPLPPEKGVKGDDGKNGVDGESQQIQINPTTKDLEVKRSSERFWTVLVPCSELIKSCPGVTIGIGDE